MPDLDKARLDWIDQNHYSRGQTVDVVEEDEAGKGYPSCKFSCDREGSWHEPDCNPPVKLLILLIDALCAHPTCGSGHRKIYSRQFFTNCAAWLLSVDCAPTGVEARPSAALPCCIKRTGWIEAKVANLL